MFKDEVPTEIMRGLFAFVCQAGWSDLSANDALKLLVILNFQCNAIWSDCI